MNLKLSELIKAYTALNEIVDLPSQTAPSLDLWLRALKSRNYLKRVIENLGTSVEVHDDTV